MGLPFRVPIKMALSARIPAHPGRLWSDVFFQTEMSVSISVLFNRRGELKHSSHAYKKNKEKKLF